MALFTANSSDHADSGEQRVEVQLPRDPGCAALARRWLEQHVDEDRAGWTLGDLKLVVTELVNNAYLHGRGQIGLILALREGRVRVEVTDEGSGQVIKIRDAAGSGGGMGLRIVEAMSSSWGAFEGTTHVWAELALDPTG